MTRNSSWIRTFPFLSLRFWRYHAADPESLCVQFVCWASQNSLWRNYIQGVCSPLQRAKIRFCPAIKHSSDQFCWANTDISKDNIEILLEGSFWCKMSQLSSPCHPSPVCSQYLWYPIWHTSNLRSPSSAETKSPPKANHTDVIEVKYEIQQNVFSCLKNPK